MSLNNYVNTISTHVSGFSIHCVAVQSWLTLQYAWNVGFIFFTQNRALSSRASYEASMTEFAALWLQLGLNILKMKSCGSIVDGMPYIEGYFYFTGLVYNSSLMDHSSPYYISVATDFCKDVSILSINIILSLGSDIHVLVKEDQIVV